MERKPPAHFFFQLAGLTSRHGGGNDDGTRMHLNRVVVIELKGMRRHTVDESRVACSHMLRRTPNRGRANATLTRVFPRYTRPRLIEAENGASERIENRFAQYFERDRRDRLPFEPHRP